jgi:hypothetical protein
MNNLRTDEEEARDRDDEARYWAQYQGSGKCLFVALLLFACGSTLMTLPLWRLLA